MAGMTKFATGVATTIRCLALASLVVLAGCETTPIEQVPDDAVVIDGPAEFKGMTKEQVQQDEKRLADAERTREPPIRTDYPQTQPVAYSAPVSGFPQPPSDRRSDCDDPNGPFVQWIQSVQQRADGGGACLNSRGVYLINSEGAKKSRYCAQFYSGTEREQSLQQAVEYDRVAAEAQSTMRGTCG